MKTNKTLSLFMFLMLALCAAAGAAFKDRDWSPRASGQGGAFAAADDDATAVLYNPAGTAFLSQQEFSFMYSKLFTGLDEVDASRQYAVYCLPTKIISLTAGWTHMGANDRYQEDAYLLSGASDISGLFSSLLGERQSVAAGITLKYLSHGYKLDERTKDDPVFTNGTDKGAPTADCGLLFRQAVGDSSGVNLGLSARNLIEPDLGLKEEDRVPLETRLGLSYYTTGISKLCSLSGAVDLVQRDGESAAHMGFECWPVQQFGLRAGYNPDEAAFGVSGEFAIDNFDVRVDYTFLLPTYVEESSGSHSVGLTVRFP